MTKPFLLVIIKECVTKVTNPLFMTNLYLVDYLQFPINAYNVSKLLEIFLILMLIGCM
jgi:hypothetical protein